MSLSKRRTHVSWFGAAVVIGVLAAGFALPRARTSREEQLIRSADSQQWRPVAGRLAGFGYRPRQPANGETNWALLSVASSLTNSWQSDGHTSGVAALLSGKSAEAVAKLERVVASDKRNADAWSDLAAARYEASVPTDDVRTIAESLAAADRALEIDPKHPAALFNRGLALDALGIRFASIEAWKRYLAVDGTSPWATEARERFAKVNVPTRDDQWQRDQLELDAALTRGDATTVERITQVFPTHVYRRAETYYFRLWADAFLAGNSQAAAKALAAVRLISDALIKRNGEHLFADALEHLDANAARGFQAYSKGWAENQARNPQSAYDDFDAARKSFAVAKSPMEVSAAYQAANQLIDLHRAAEAVVLSTEAESRLPPSCALLHPFMAWQHARETESAGRHFDTLQFLRTGRKLFERLGDVDYAVRLDSFEGSTLAQLGRDREAWQRHRAALAGAAATGRANLIQSALDSVGLEAARQGQDDLAKSCLALESAIPNALPLTHFEDVVWLESVKAQEHGEPLRNAAFNDVLAAVKPQQQSDAYDELRLAQAMSLRNSNVVAAEHLFSEVLTARSAKKTLNAPLYLQRARVRRSTNDVSGAEADYRAAIAMIEGRDETIADPAISDSFLGYSRDAYDDLADLLLSRGDWKGAFDISERIHAVKHRPLTLAAIATAIPPNTIGVHYNSFASKILIVVIERGRVFHTVVDCDRTTLEALKTDAASEGSARRLYDLLIAPFRDRLSPDRELIIVPDDTTYGIPFAALRSDDGRYLIEETPVSIAPSAAAMMSTAPTLDPRHSTITLLSDPTFSPTLFPDLGRLVAARDDANAVRPLFSKTNVFTGNEATRTALSIAAAESNVLHIGAHALSSPRDASLSLIALAATDRDNGVLYLDEIASLQLTKRPLVVLAGCQTALLGGGHGTIRSLAAAFLAAGSRAVLGTLWNVDDAAASTLTTAFYSNLSQGFNTAQALRQAQLSVMRSVPAREWGAFQVEVGYGVSTIRRDAGV